ncbi:MAG TPA: phosphoribosylanthranilate isomerase, partial [Nitrososphaerales archaeon]|nr:phosphoribosylanthranilate isomerase [Nitrososphaerales archaeon]
PSSTRNISLGRASRLMDLVPPFVNTVLVTTSTLIRDDMSDLRRMRMNDIQLYGDPPSPEAIRSLLRVGLIKPYPLRTSEALDVAGAVAGFDALLTDTYRDGMQGGTGRVSDWELCLKVRERIAPTPMILSGGLTPENVADAIRRVRPFAVDASSGVELSPGIKDHGKIREFVARAREAG